MNKRALSAKRLVPLSVGLLALLPAGAGAQAGPDFLFGRPKVSLGMSVGYSVPRAGSEIFDLVTEELTVSRSDFRAPAWGGEFAFRATERLDLVFDVGYARSSTRSEFRGWVDQDDLPIEQSTRLKRIPVTLSARYFLFERGRTVSRFAWVPARWSPYLGAGGGWMSYDFKQTGDFVDFQDLSIFTYTYRSHGRVGMAHLFSGVELSLAPNWVVRGEARYAWARADMGTDFRNFDPIDLTGFQGTVGVAVRF